MPHSPIHRRLLGGRLAASVRPAGILALAFALIASLAGCSASELRDPPPVPTEAATFATGEVAAAAQAVLDAGAPAVLVEVRNGDEVWRAALGVTKITGGTRPDPLASVRIASVTKSMLGTILLQLVDEGRLDLDAPLSEVLPGFRLGREAVRTDGALSLAPTRTAGAPEPTPSTPAPVEPTTLPPELRAGDDVAVDAAGAAILNPADSLTPRMLAQHVSGLPEYVSTFPLESLDTVAGVLAGDYSLDDLLDRIAGQPWTSAPGGAFVYTNTNYIVLSMLVERLTGKPLAEVMQERIFDRGALTASSLPTGIELPADAAHGYFTVGGLQIDVGVQSASLWAGAGGVVSTVGDVNSFYRALMQGTYLTPGALAAQLDLNDSGYGIGIMGRGDPCTAQAPVVVPTEWPDPDAAASPSSSASSSTSPGVSASPSASGSADPSAVAPPGASGSPSPGRTAGSSPSPTPTTIEIGRPGMAYGHLGSGLGYRIASFSSPDGLRQATIAWTASPVDYGADPRLEPAYRTIDAALAATCPAA